VIGDNWSFVLAAYALTALVLVAYWRHLVRRERELDRIELMGRREFKLDQPGRKAPTDESDVRSHAASVPAHPRSKPDSTTPLQ
jgi:heme exporter protein D